EIGDSIIDTFALNGYFNIKAPREVTKFFASGEGELHPPNRANNLFYSQGSHCAPQWALRDSNPRPAECKWDRFGRQRSSMVAFVGIFYVFRRQLSVLSCA